MSGKISKHKLEGGLKKKGLFDKKGSSGHPLISIITVCWNCDNDIEKTLKSVIEQDYKNVEYVLVDGGSTDGTIDIIKKYEDKIAYFVSEPDKGIYDAMNKGIYFSDGDWIIFLGAGDKFHNSKVVKDVVSSINHGGKCSDIIYGHANVCYASGFSRIQKNRDMQDIWKGMIICTQTLFCKKEVFFKYKFDFRIKIAADFDFIIRCYKNGLNFYDSRIVIADISDKGLSDNNRLRTTVQYWQVARKHLNGFKINAYYVVLIICMALLEGIKKILPSKVYDWIVKRYWKSV